MLVDTTKKSARYLYATVLSHQEMQSFINKGFRNHESIFPIINFHLFQSSASKVSVTKFMAKVKNDIKKMDTRCNQIDTLQAKLAKLTSNNADKDYPGKLRGKPTPGGAAPGGNPSPS